MNPTVGNYVSQKKPLNKISYSHNIGNRPKFRQDQEYSLKSEYFGILVKPFMVNDSISDRQSVQQL